MKNGKRVLFIIVYHYSESFLCKFVILSRTQVEIAFGGLFTFKKIPRKTIR